MRTLRHALRTLTCYNAKELSISDARQLASRELRWLAQSASDRQDFFDRASRCASGEPLAYVIGRIPFYPLPRPLLVRAPVLIPRPETEAWVNELIERALCLFRDQRTLRILDIGTGTGCIALALHHALRHCFDVDTIAIDVNSTALKLASENASLLGLPVRVRKVDLFADDLAKQLGRQRIDLIVSNPPYISAQEMARLPRSVLNWEDRNALEAADEGLAFYKRIAQGLPELAADRALCVVEIGHAQGNAVSAILNLDGWSTAVKHDPWGKERTVWAERLSRPR